MEKEDLLLNFSSELKTFKELYASRPIKDNLGGMGFNHSFALWKMLKILDPNLVVESGIWKGHSTWLIEAASPNARIISFDTDLSKRKYISTKTIYVENDFRFYDWSSENLVNSVIFFDDHQNSFFRILLANFFGFKQMIFEDNYSVNQGDFYSLNHVFSNSGFPDIQMTEEYRKRLRTIIKRAWYMPVLRRAGSHQNWIIPRNKFDAENLKIRISNMLTFPRILESDGSIAIEFTDSVLDGTLLNFVEELDCSYNNITFLKLK